MNCIIAGTRTAMVTHVESALRDCPWTSEITTVFSGTCRGADLIGEMWAARKGISVRRFPANWDAVARVHFVALAAEGGLIAVWDGKSRGTADMIKVAREAGLRIFVWRMDLLRAEQ